MSIQSLHLHRAAWLLALCFPCPAITAAGQSLNATINAEFPALTDTYKDLHAHPELSHNEVRTAAILAEALR